MAQVASPLSQRAHAVFNSVFTGASISQPSRQENKRIKLDVAPASIRRDLHHGLKSLLGIENNNRYAYGHDGPTAEGQPFLIPINICQPMNTVRRPNQSDYLQQRSRHSKSPIGQSLRRWQSQLGTDHLKKLIAEVLDKLLVQYIRWAYRGCFRTDVVAHLEYWVRYVFTGLVRLCLEVLDSPRRASKTQWQDQGELGDLSRWQEIALTNLGAIRVEELFGMIVSWDEEVNGINDLKRFITSPATRSYLTTQFTDALSTKLLHPAASTIEILQHYISIIRAFRKLDPKGVLLDRVARRVRKYLKDRDDTVKAIVGGLLSDPFDANGQPIPSNADTLTELALELSRRDELDGNDDNGELDWDNMNWMPDPVDAAPDYMKSKNTDVIGSLTSLFESKDVFVKELQTTLGDRLLKNKPDFDLEISVVDLLKTRFGDNALQACEVMLRDILDSRKVDEVIRKGQTTKQAAPPVPPGDADTPELHTKILSRLFWPTMSDQGFKLPPNILEQQSTYESGFETLKHSRKLTWLNSIGHVEVELHLEDRVVQEEVLPYQASVIYAFQSHSSPLSIADIASQLEMSPTLARSACIFWLSKRVLTESPKDTFSVLERLLPPPTATTTTTGTTNPDIPMPDPTLAPTTTQLPDAAAAAAEAAAALAAKEATELARKQKMAVYQQFIISMLTNQGAMPLARIAMMLGIVVPGGFPFGMEELREFLGGMVKEGTVEVGMGGNYRIL
jgi:anaphase-promoting complex subunit 2